MDDKKFQFQFDPKAVYQMEVLLAVDGETSWRGALKGLSINDDVLKWILGCPEAAHLNNGSKLGKDAPEFESCWELLCKCLTGLERAPKDPKMAEECLHKFLDYLASARKRLECRLETEECGRILFKASGDNQGLHLDSAKMQIHIDSFVGPFGSSN